MNRAMYLACFLFIELGMRTVPPNPVLNADGSIDEARTFTPGQMASIARLLTPAQREFYLSPPKHRAHVRGQRIG
jgi:hypothetical protein